MDMDLVSHLEELRKRLMITLGAFIAFFILAIVYAKNVYQWIVEDLTIQLALLGPSDIIWVYSIKLIYLPIIRIFSFYEMLLPY
ncbi:twin-arginine translocase subunit TatC [Bacillus sp. Marseille-P3661]|uniref:twin-arginine translocase subunit TatC n=1 Tax=Bacillus sp. Marseille-P3661 TaxID=1936234 RepID=UPI002155C287|nr:twin-arginine translocase subunit TatC [Bacillus sp. Marseille-P3661]